MRGKVSKLINRHVAEQNIDGRTARNGYTKMVKRTWNATPRNKRHALAMQLAA